MSRRVLARPLAAATLSAMLVLTAPLAYADGSNGGGGGKDAAPGQTKDQTKDEEKDKGEQGDQSGDTGSSDSSDDQGDQGGSGGKDQAPGQQEDKSKDKPKDEAKDKGPQGVKGSNGNAGGNGKGNGGAKGGGKGGGSKGDPAGNNGTVKIAPYGEMDSIPNNSPHPGCTFQVEWYGFDEGPDVVSTVSFVMHAPTSDVGLSVSGPREVFVGGDPASGAGTESGLDGRQPYTLSFDGEPHPKQGYHVKLTVSTPRSQGNDTKSKVFWVAPCEAGTEGATDGTSDVDEECTGDMTGGTDGSEGTEDATEECVGGIDDECTGVMDGSTDSSEGTEDATEECVGGIDDECTGVMDGSTDSSDDTDDATEECTEGVGGTSAGGSKDQGVAGTQLAAVTTPVQNFAGLLTNADSSADTAAVPTSVDAGAEGGLSALTDSPWPLVALVAGLLAGLGALVMRRRAGA